MKYSVMFKIFVGIILLMIIIFVVQKLATLKPDLFNNDFGYSTTIELPTVVKIDTVTTIITIYDTVYAEADTIYITEDDTIAVINYEPELEHLGGNIHIRYEYSNKHFTIVNNLEVFDNEIYITETEFVKIPPKLFRPSVVAGYFKGEKGGVIMLGAGVTLVDRLSINFAALSNEMIGCVVEYDF